ncbi:MAG: hypothetical protein WBF33_34105 [Candidatus Nitrosopolaris sp.]|jgi:hypothetical protein
MPDGLNRELYKVFEKYGIKDSKTIVCLWKNNQINCAMRSNGRERELIDRVKDWFGEKSTKVLECLFVRITPLFHKLGQLPF